MDKQTLARGLGYFSLGLGAMELFMPGKLAKFLGVEGNERLLQAMGAREMGNGVAILLEPDSAPRLWARVAGDAVDLALLTSAMINSRKKGSVGFAIANVAAVTALDVIGSMKLSRAQEAYD